MPKENWVLFDQTTSVHCGDGAQFGDKLTAKFNVLKSGLSQGVETVHLSNGLISVIVVPTRGMNLWKAAYTLADGSTEQIGWDAPTRGPVHPNYVNEADPSGLGWLDGFDELLARCGLESNGAPEFNEHNQLTYPLHGKISNRPAHKLDLSIDEEAGKLSLTGWVEETRFHFLKVSMKSTIHLTLGQSGFEIEDEITNISASPAEIQMLYHMNFGQPLLGANTQLFAPFKEVVPRNAHAATGISDWTRYKEPQAGKEEQVYFASLHAKDDGHTSALLVNNEETRAARLGFNLSQLPCLTVWKNETSPADGYVTGIEPGTNFPNPRTFEGKQGRVIKLGGKETATLKLRFDYLSSAEDIQRAKNEIIDLQLQPVIIHSKPIPSWCA